MRWAGIAAACALTALAVLLSAPSALAHSPQPPRSFFGVVSQTHTLTDADLERMKRGHVGMVRVALPWQEVDPTPDPDDYDWRDFDGVVSNAARHGVAVLPTVYTVPQWVAALGGCHGSPAGPCSITPPKSAYALSLWRTFLTAAVARYGHGGSFWSAHPAVPRRPIETWQIWNEENSPGFFQPRPDPERYAALLRAASEAIHGQDASAQILIGGLFGYPRKGRGGGLRATEYLRDLYAIPDISAAFDGVAIHPYASRISGVEGQVRRINQIIHQAGDDEAGLWITEIGWASGGGPQPLNRGREGQAKRLRQAFRFFEEKRVAMRIQAVLWYAWRDVSLRDSICSWCARSGLFPIDSLKRPKPAWHAFTAFTGGR